ncbi:hypothetical protein KL86DYS2_12621 [uncultured Dysgonomonas sp.]|uniref:Uncharacterized protein n=1 Tax=uncultured Dysgonomonas sp. TaxID=206096 RepID=A0A212JYR2_9BACT|nr:hypothetical protein KL86DYS2_12621 [uncultured Dysgonomonas sp.]
MFIYKDINCFTWFYSLVTIHIKSDKTRKIHNALYQYLTAKR